MSRSELDEASSNQLGEPKNLSSHITIMQSSWLCADDICVMPTRSSPRKRGPSYAKQVCFFLQCARFMKFVKSWSGVWCLQNMSVRASQSARTTLHNNAPIKKAEQFTSLRPLTFICSRCLGRQASWFDLDARTHGGGNRHALDIGALGACRLCLCHRIGQRLDVFDELLLRE